jgi:glutamate formiminotransferase/formiminotetrahydrofolate cyclodeaminase
MKLIRQVTDEIEYVKGIKLLDVDPGKDTNRTVVTFVGAPEEVCEAAFRAVKKASELIDMSKHKGEHPRMGATDVLPLIPVSGISMEETVEYARRLGKRIGDELGIAVYCYENAAFSEQRRNLASCRSGEYEGLPEKLSNPVWKPDFGPGIFNRKSGATAVGARDFLVAFNINLNTTSTRRANAIAFDVREKGRDIVSVKGEKTNIPGSLKKVKAIGWFIEEYGIAQISMNLTDISVTPVHIAFDEVCRKAEARGIRVSGSELVGLMPLKSLLDAGIYFLKKQRRSWGVSDKELIHIAIKSMGLNELHEFIPEEKIIEYVMADKSKKELADMSLRSFMDETASESPAPGGGSVAAYIGAVGAALGTMVANLSGHKKGWDERWEEFGQWAEKGKAIQNELLLLVDEDTEAFKGVMAAYALPRKTTEEAETRRSAVQDAILAAIRIPLNVMKTAVLGYELVRAMVKTGNPNSVTDAGVGALALNTCIRGAYLNVRTNLKELEDKKLVMSILQEADSVLESSLEQEAEILRLVEKSLGF